MKLKEEFVAHDIEDDSYLVATGDSSFSGLVKGNKTFGAIIQLLSQETSEEEIVEGLLNRFDADRAVIAEDVHTAVARLREIGAIEG